MRIIAVINPKGGVAKTTTVRNLAHVLATRYQKKVLVCDTDSNSILTMSYAISGGPRFDKMFGMAALLVNEYVSAMDVIQKTAYPNVDIIPCDVDLAVAADKLDDPMNPYQFRIREKLAPLSAPKVAEEYRYDYCIIDAKGSLERIVTSILFAAQDIIVPMDCTMTALKTTNDMIQILANSRKCRIETSRLLLTKVETGKHDHEFIRDVIPAMPLDRFDTYIRKSTDVKWGEESYKAIAEINPKVAAAVDYDNVAAEYLGLPLPHEGAASIQRLLDRNNAQN